MNKLSNHQRSSSKDLKSPFPLKYCHRRTLSTILPDCPRLQNQATSTSLVKFKKKSGFLGLLDAAVTYFTEESKFPIDFPQCDLDLLKQQNEKIQEKILKIRKKTENVNEKYTEL